MAREWLLRIARPLFGRFAPFDPAYRRNPHDTFRDLREHAPVYRSRAFGTWMLSRYDDCRHVLRDKNFTTDRSDTAIVRFIARRLTGSPELGAVLERSLLTLDGDEHARLRRLVSKAFTPRRVEALRPRLESVVGELYDRAARNRQIDFVREVAHPFPAIAIAELLGVPSRDQDFFLSCSARLVQLLDPAQGKGGVKPMQAAAHELFAYFRGLLADRRSEPRDDLLSAMLVAEEEGDRLDERDLLALASLLLVAGHETTSNLIGNAAVILVRNPGERKRLAERPELIGSAVDEFLRVEGPIMLTDRAVVADCEIGGVELKAGQMVAVLLAAANRDPAHFPDPERIDLSRVENHHLSFGQGAHFCLGSQLAKLECELAIGQLMRRFPNWSADPDPNWRRSMVVRGPESLRMRLAG